MSDGGQFKSFFDNLMRRQAREAGAEDTMRWLEGFPQYAEPRRGPLGFLGDVLMREALAREDAGRAAFDAFMTAERAIEGFSANALRGQYAEPGSMPYDWDLTLPEVYREMGAPDVVADVAGTVQSLGLPSVLDAVPGLSTVSDIAEIVGDVGRVAGKAAPGALGFLPAPIMRALGKITGVVEEGGSVVPMGHGTTVAFDTPRPSTRGLHGSGLYVAPNRSDLDPNSDFNFYAQGEGGRVLPGFIGVSDSRMLRPDDTDALLNDEQLQSFRQLVNKYLSPENTSREYYEDLLDSEVVNHEQFFEFIYSYVPSNEMTNTIRNTGFDAMWDEGFEVGTIYNPEESFLPAYDNQRITDFINQNRDVLTDDEYAEAMASLQELGRPLSAASDDMAAVSAAIENVSNNPRAIESGSSVPATTEVTIGKLERRFPGLYNGTFSNPNRQNVRYTIEKMDLQTTEYPEEYGMWRLDVDGDVGSELYRTLAEAKEALRELAEWYE